MTADINRGKRMTAVPNTSLKRFFMRNRVNSLKITSREKTSTQIPKLSETELFLPLELLQGLEGISKDCFYVCVMHWKCVCVSTLLINHAQGPHTLFTKPASKNARGPCITLSSLERKRKKRYSITLLSNNFKGQHCVMMTKKSLSWLSMCTLLVLCLLRSFCEEETYWFSVIK